MNSTNTTMAGILAALAALATAVNYFIDGDPSTQPDWGATISLILVAVGLVKARDNDKSSEDVGAK